MSSTFKISLCPLHKGLESPKQEFSVENITFKILRRNGILDLLDQLKTQAYDSMLDIREE